MTVSGSVRPEPDRPVLAAYAFPAIPLAVLALPLYVLVPAHYAEGLGLPLAAVGQALLLIRILDAVSDPITGILVDRFRPRFGRRRTWVLLSAPPTALAAAMIFLPPEQAAISHLVLWGAVLSVSWTAMQIAYGAWGAELSRSYAGRTRVAAWREGATVIGTLLALSAPALLPMTGLEGSGAVLAAFAVFVGFGLPISALVAVRRVPEPIERRRSSRPFLVGMRSVLGNRPFRRLLGAFFINGLANGLPGALFVFYVTHRLETPAAVGPLLLLYFICAIFGVPLWLKLATRFSKHHSWTAGMLTAVFAFSFAPFLGPGDIAAFAVITAVTGFALGADVVLPASIQADVIDLDTIHSGEERAGFYLSLWTLAAKLALAGGVGIAFPLLAQAGFDPGAGRVSAEGVELLGWLYAGIPSLLKLFAVAAVFDFPVDRRSADALSAELGASEDQSAGGPDAFAPPPPPVVRPTSLR